MLIIGLSQVMFGSNRTEPCTINFVTIVNERAFNHTMITYQEGFFVFLLVDPPKGTDFLALETHFLIIKAK